MENREILKELHLQVGYVVQASQYMEMMISSSLAALSNSSDQILPDHEFNEKYDVFSQKTLGKLCGLLQKNRGGSEEKLSIIKRAVDDRNHVIHSIFTDQKYTIRTDQGCTEALNRVRLARENIDPAVEILDFIVKESFKNELSKVNS